MSCCLRRRALAALAAWSFAIAAVIAPTLLGQSHVSAQAKPGAGHGRAIARHDPYLAIPVTGLPDKMVWTIAFDPDDRPWVGTNRGGAVQQDDGAWRWLSRADGLAGEAVKAYLFPPGGSMWVGTNRAIDVFAAPDSGQRTAEYTWDDGLAASSAEDLAVDANGDIWAAHLAEGVSRFDGKQWRKYTIDEGLADNWVNSIAADPGGKVWFGTLGGASLYDGDTWTTYTSEDGLAGDWVSDVAIAPNGHVWFATDGGVSEYDGENWTTHLAGRHARSVAVAPGGVVWAAGSGFVGYFDGNAWHAVQETYFVDQLVISLALRTNGEVWVGSLEDGATILKAAQSGSTQAPFDGTLWLGTPAGVTMLQGSEQRRFDVTDGLAGSDVRAILIDREGRKWFGTDGGASMYDGFAWTSYYPSYSSISSNYVHALAIDPQGRTWFTYGDRGLGASVKDGDTWFQYTTDDGLASENVYSVAFGPRGQTWLGTAHGVGQLNGTRWVDLSKAAGGPEGKITALAVSPAGYLWAGYDGGVAKYDGKQWTAYGAADGLPAARVSALVVDPSGRVWAGAAPDRATSRAGGLYVFEHGSWREVAVNCTRSGASGPAPQPLGDWISALALDAAGQLWVGARSYPLAKPGFVVGGVSVRSADTLDGAEGQGAGTAWTAYTLGDGLVSDYVTSVAVDAAGKYWVGTQYGLSMFDGETWTTHTMANGLPDKYITGLAADAAGGLWVATWGGGAAYFDGDTFTTTTTLGLADRAINSIAEDGDGNIWFATEGGVSRFDGESTWDVYTTLDGLADNASSAVAVDGQGTVWVGSGQDKYEGAALSSFDGERWLTYALRSNTDYNNVVTIAVSADGTPWAVAYNPAQFSSTSALFGFDGETWHAAGEPGPLVDDRVYAFAIEAGPTVGTKSGSRMWFGTDGSYGSPPLLAHAGEEWSAFPLDGGAGGEGDTVRALALSGPGAGWIGTNTSLLHFVLDQGSITFEPVAQVQNTAVQAIAVEQGEDQ